MTLARFVIVYQKGGDCKGILPLTIILVTMTPLLEYWTNYCLQVNIIRYFSPLSFLVHQWNRKVKGDPPFNYIQEMKIMECCSPLWPGRPAPRPAGPAQRSGRPALRPDCPATAGPLAICNRAQNRTCLTMARQNCPAGRLPGRTARRLPAPSPSATGHKTGVSRRWPGPSPGGCRPARPPARQTGRAAGWSGLQPG